MINSRSCRITGRILTVINKLLEFKTSLKDALKALPNGRAFCINMSKRYTLT